MIDQENKVKHFVVFALLLGFPYLLAFTHRFILSVVGSDMAHTLTIDPAYLALLTSTYFYIYGFAQAPSGMLIDRFGSRRIILCALIIAGVGGVMFAMAQSVTQASIARILVGLGSAPMLIGALALISRALPQEKQASAYSIVYFIGGLGPLIAASPMAFLSTRFGWRYACLSVALLTLLYAVILYVCLNSKYEKTHIEKAKSKEKHEGGVKAIVKNFNFWTIALFGFGIPSMYLMFASLWIGTYLRDVYQYSAIETSGVLTIGAIGAVVGFLLGPFLADKVLKSRRTVLLIFGLIVCVSVAPFILGLKLSSFSISLQMLLIGIFSTGSQPVAVLAIKDMFDKKVIGSAMGIYNTFPLVGAGIIQLLTGVLIRNLSAASGLEMAYKHAFILPFVLCVFGTTAIFFLKENKVK